MKYVTEAKKCAKREKKKVYESSEEFRRVPCVLNHNLEGVSVKKVT